MLFTMFSLLSRNNTMVEGGEGKIDADKKVAPMRKENGNKNKISSVCGGVVSICMRHDFIDQVPVDGPTVIAQS
jgi:hypothetical protein